MNMEKIHIFYFCFMGLLIQSLAFQPKDKVMKRHHLHHLIKRMAPMTNTGTGHHVGNGYTESSSRGVYRTSSLPRSSFVSQDGQPYYEYRPHVSTSRGQLPGLSGGPTRDSNVNTRQHTQVRGANTRGHSSVRQPLVHGTTTYTTRTRTYRYPFGRARVQYESEPEPQIGGYAEPRTRTGDTEEERRQHAIDELLRQQREQQQQEAYGRSANNQRQQVSGRAYQTTNNQQASRSYGANNQQQQPTYGTNNGQRTRTYYRASTTGQRSGSSYPHNSGYNPGQSRGSYTRYYPTNQGSQVNQYPAHRTRYQTNTRTYYQPRSQPRQQYPNTGQFDVRNVYDPYNPYGVGGGSEGGINDCPETGIDLRIDGMTCQEAVTHHGAHVCYTHEYTSRSCCEVCRRYKQVDKPGCEYGDHGPQCANISPSDCYNVRNRQSCCESCERMKISGAQPGCEYGDLSPQCDNVRQNTGLCYIPDNERLCCGTCAGIRNNSNPECPWGDYNNELCSLFDPGTLNVRINCYSPHRRRLCCASCERLRQWVPDDIEGDCQYGDRPVIFNTERHGHLNCSTILNHFSLDECRDNPAVSVNCCYTCHRHLVGRG